MMRTHQPDQAVFRSVLPEDTGWEPFLAFIPSARLAVVVGQPTGPGPYVVRGQGALRRQTDAALAPGGSRLHGHVRRFLHRPGRTVQHAGDTRNQRARNV
jgi:hypothetical protein